MTKDAVPIILTVFGTTRSIKQYGSLHEEIKKEFPRNPVTLAITSRMVRDMVAQRHGAKGVPPLPSQAINELADNGHRWAVVQSVHILAGHEFYRMLQEIQHDIVRTSIGLPLLWSKRDYDEVARIIKKAHSTGQDDRALVFIGHGTDHASWSTYPALEHILRENGLNNAWVGVIDGEPGREQIVQQVKRAGYSKADLIPLMLVSGVHVLEDIEGRDVEGDSWRAIFEAQGISTNTRRNGLLELGAIKRLFVTHIKDAMELLPL